MEQQTDTRQQVTLFAKALEQYYVAEHTARNYLPFTGTVEVDWGIKFARVVIVAPGQHSAYCFIDLSNGDILKAASYKAPAKGKRGSIWNDGFDVGNGKPCDMFGSGLYKR